MYYTSKTLMFTCFLIKPEILKKLTAWKVSYDGVISGPYFPAFVQNTERYFVPLRIQSECGKIRTRNNSVFGHFSRSDIFKFMTVLR